MSGAMADRWAGHVAADYRPDLAIICGYGMLPVEIAGGAVETGRHPYMIGIADEAGEEIRCYPGETLAWGQLGRLLNLLEALHISDVVFAGGIHKRPDFRRLKLDWGGVKMLPQALVLMLGGDNSVLSGTIKLFERHGIQVLGAHQIAPQLLAPPGPIAGRRPGVRDFDNIKLAYSACQAMGKLDIGQAAVAEAGRIVAVEAVEGTDEMLARIKRMRDIGRMPAEGKHGVLVKTMKPGQDIRADLPAIGPLTVEAVVAAGLRGVALEAGHSIILERNRTIELARKAGIYIYGVGQKDAVGDG
jgi:UDP-2,3-diacylglucosamine hydrolase